MRCYTISSHIILNCVMTYCIIYTSVYFCRNATADEVKLSAQIQALQNQISGACSKGRSHEMQRLFAAGPPSPCRSLAAASLARTLSRSAAMRSDSMRGGVCPTSCSPEMQRFFAAGPPSPCRRLAAASLARTLSRSAMGGGLGCA